MFFLSHNLEKAAPLYPTSPSSLWQPSQKVSESCVGELLEAFRCLSGEGEGRGWCLGESILVSQGQRFAVIFSFWGGVMSENLGEREVRDGH